jgi:hypothetical protein
MSLWRLTDDGAATPVQDERLAAEALIESAVESAPELLGVDVLIVGRQVVTPSGPLDLLALNAEGHLVVVENKRDRTPRDVLAQTLDYAAYVSTLAFDDVAAIYESYRLRSGVDQTDLAEEFEERFGEQLDAIAYPPQMIVVASRMDDSTERMIGFLAEGFGVPVNAALFQPFADGLIGRTWLRTEEPTRHVGRSSSNTESREQAKVFWDAWLPIGRSALPGIRLPTNGPRSVLIKRRIMAGVLASLTVWVSSSEAYAEVQFDDDDPSMNEALLDALKTAQSAIESAFGEPLEWRGPEGLMTKRTKVVASKVSIGDRTDSTAEGLNALAESARRLVAAVLPYLRTAGDAATAAMVELESEVELVDAAVEPLREVQNAAEAEAHSTTSGDSSTAASPSEQLVARQE